MLVSFPDKHNKIFNQKKCKEEPMKSTFYESPKFSFVFYECEDVIRTSPEGNFTGNEDDDIFLDDIY